MKRSLLILMFVVTLFSSCLNNTTSTEVEVVTAEEMIELTQLQDVQLIDVRTSEEFDEGFIANAQNIDYLSPNFDEEIQKLDKSKPVVVYCNSGGRSAKCVEKMEDAGFVKIYELEGGIAKWKHKGYDVEEESAP